MPTLARDDWELENAEEQNSGPSVQFQLPSREERTELREGAQVILLFRFRDDAGAGDGESVERMVVFIDRVAGATYEGTLQSRPESGAVLQQGDRISFGPEHVAAILRPPSDPRHPRQVLARQFRVKRFRQIAVLVALIPALIVAKLGDGVAGLVNAPPAGVWGVAIGVIAFAVVFSLWNWRCPGCGASLGRSLNATACPRCGCSFVP
jgi:hypothetical protein